MPHPPLHTPLVDVPGCTVPFIAAGMGGVARQLSERLPNLHQAWLRQELQEVLRLHQVDE